MAVVDWFYHRKNCNSCSKADAFLESGETEVKTQVDARKTRLGEDDAIQLLADVEDLYVTRGVKVIHYDLRKGFPERSELLDLIVGRSGNLRAPTIKVGQNVVVGFDQETYEKVL